MSHDADGGNDFEGTGIVVANPTDNPDNMDLLAHSVLDDVLFNILHDILLKTHREEKTAKANTAAIVIEQEAAHQLEDKSTPDSSSKPHSNRIENESAIYEDGAVYIKGNPLANVKEIRCPKCGLPKLLHPTDGNGARLPDEGKVYCGRHPFVSKPGHDIYGNPFPKDDVGSGGKKAAKDKSKASNNLLKTASTNANGTSQNDTPADSSFSSPGPSPPPGDLPSQTQPKTKSVFPNVECPNCGRSINVRVFARHLNGHLKGGGRASSRAAMVKMNGANGSQNGSTPPGSRRGTPSVSGVKNSPQKRGAEEMEDDDDDNDRNGISSGDEGDDDDSPKKKKRRKNAPHSSSTPTLPHTTTTSEIKPKLKLKVKDPVSTGTTGVVKKWKSGKVTIDGKTVDPATRILPPVKPEKETRVLPPPRKIGGTAAGAASVTGSVSGEDRDRHSSQTMSSPPG